MSKEKSVVKKAEGTLANRFIAKVTQEMANAVGQGVKFSESQKRLAMNLFVKVDNDLQNAEADRLKKKKGGEAIIWQNVNMQKLALDAAHRITLGLDALVPNHLFTIPYLNGKTNKYDLDLRIGYKGMHHYRVKFSSDDVVDIRYELVHKNDHFKLLKRNEDRSVESYEFEVKNPFDRGEVIGGFGYIVYSDETKNKVVVVSREYFDKIKNAWQSGPVWKSEWEEQMQYKTIVHRTTEMLNIDTTKTNMSYHYVESQDDPFRDELDPKKAVHLEGEREKLDFDMQEEEPEVEQEKPEANKEELDNQIDQEDLPFK